MARNEVFRDADALSLPVPPGTPSGAPVKVGGLFGVTQTPEGEGGNPEGFATVWLKGAHRFTVTGAVAAKGEAIYITDAGTLTTTATGNTRFGFSYSTKGAGDGELVVIIRESNGRP